METNLVEQTPAEITKFGMDSLRQLRELVTNRPDKDKLVIGGKQYLYYYDWQLLGRFFGIIAGTETVEEIIEEEPLNIGGETNLYVKRVVGYKAKAAAWQNGQKVSNAMAICMLDEPNWKNKQRSFAYSMAQTRSCAKALRNCLEWVVKMPVQGQQQIEFADDIAEEM